MQDDNNKKAEEVEETAPAAGEAPAEEKVDVKEESLVSSGEEAEPSEEKVETEAEIEETPAEPEAQANAVKEETLVAAGEEEEPAQEEVKEEPKKASSPSDNAKWYIVHTYSGHENKVAKSLRQRIESMGFETRIFDIIVPTRDTVKVSQGKKENIKEKIFPGYVLIKMILDDESWLLVRTTQGVTAFIGAGNKPTPISDKEVEAIQKFMATEEPLYKASFTVGEAVKIVDGPFADFLGTIDNIDEAKGKLKVLVSIFGRETPVELDFLQVNKL